MQRGQHPASLAEFAATMSCDSLSRLAVSIAVAFAALGRQTEALEVPPTSRMRQHPASEALRPPEQHQAVRGGLLQSVGGHVHAQELVGKDSRGPRGPEFFDDPPVGADANPQENLQGKRVANMSCHPTCSWTCSTSQCNAKCKPICKAPMCMTACQKPRISECRQVCKDPHCVVVCPPGPTTQCETGACPTCQTVCGKPDCKLDCGQGRLCKSTCADPVCAWQCDRESCPEPECKLNCDQPKFCGFVTPQPTLHEVYAGQGKDTLDGHENPAAEYAGRELAWNGLAKVPVNQLISGAASPTGPLMAVPPQVSVGAQPMEGAQPLPKNPCADFCSKAPAPAPGDAVAASGSSCNCKIQAEADINTVPKWIVVAHT